MYLSKVFININRLNSSRIANSWIIPSVYNVASIDLNQKYKCMNGCFTLRTRRVVPKIWKKITQNAYNLQCVFARTDH